MRRDRSGRAGRRSPARPRRATAPGPWSGAGRTAADRRARWCGQGVEQGVVAAAEAADDRRGEAQQRCHDGGPVEHHVDDEGAHGRDPLEPGDESGREVERPLVEQDSRKRSERGSKGAVSRTTATSASSGRSTSLPCRTTASERAARRRCAGPARAGGDHLVVQHRHRTGLGGIPLVAEVASSHRHCGGVLVDVGVIEQAEPELHGEDAAGRLVDARLGDGGPAPRGRAGCRRTPRHRTGRRRPRGMSSMRPCGSRCSTPQARAGSTWSPTWLSLNELPVGDDDAVVAQLLAEQPGHDLLVVAEADRLDLHAVDDEVDRHAVVGHDPGGPASMIGGNGLRWSANRPPGLDLLAPVGEVRVLAVFCGPPPGSACSCTRHCPALSESPWKPLRYATPSSVTRSGS